MSESSPIERVVLAWFTDGVDEATRRERARALEQLVGPYRALCARCHVGFKRDAGQGFDVIVSLQFTDEAAAQAFAAACPRPVERALDGVLGGLKRYDFDVLTP